MFMKKPRLFIINVDGLKLEFDLNTILSVVGPQLTRGSFLRSEHAKITRGQKYA